LTSVAVFFFAYRQNVGASKRLTLDWVPVSLKSKELELARSICDSGSITKIIVRLLSTRVEQKKAIVVYSAHPRRPRPSAIG